MLLALEIMKASLDFYKDKGQLGELQAMVSSGVL